MNKHQEALDLLYELSWRFSDLTDSRHNQIKVAKVDLQELVDKATPMIPIAYDECGSCGEILVAETRKNRYNYFKRCPECGQLVDWSNNE